MAFLATDRASLDRRLLRNDADDNLWLLHADCTAGSGSVSRVLSSSTATISTRKRRLRELREPRSICAAGNSIEPSATTLPPEHHGLRDSQRPNTQDRISLVAPEVRLLASRLHAKVKMMGDKLSIERRSWNMAQIRAQDTKPETAVRSLVHRLGYRFRLHRRELPGKPDVVLASRSCVIFVHGCFWHQHRGCIDCSRPRTNAQYWTPKLSGNVARDRRNTVALRRLGWKVITVWDCETRDLKRLAKRLSAEIPRRVLSSRGVRD